MKYLGHIQRTIATFRENRRLGLGLGAKIILPYLLLTLVIAGVGTFVLANLVTSSLQDRINTQLIDAGNIVAEEMVQYEIERLQILRAVAGTDGVADAVRADDVAALDGLVPQLLANSNADMVALLNGAGVQVYGWQRQAVAGETAVSMRGTDWSQVGDVQLVLDGFIDEAGDKRAFLTQTADEQLILFTVGPLQIDDTVSGAVLVGTNLRSMAIDLTLNAVARVTFYDRRGAVLETTLGGSREEMTMAMEQQPEAYAEIVAQLENSPVVVASPETETELRQINVQGQDYQLAFGEWQLRGRSFGIFSVALPRNFLVNTVTDSRNLFLVIFSLATIGVFVGGFLITRRLTKPIQRLVATATAVTEGHLEARSFIRGSDEIGRLAIAFDQMTETLAQRNRQLLEKNSELEAIVDSIADGVIVINSNNEIITVNPAAKRLLSDMSHDFFLGPMRELSDSFTIGAGESETTSQEAMLNQRAKQFQVGNRVLSAVGAPVKTPTGEEIGSVVVLRDITRDVEASNLKDAFITSISHELRTPLTIIKVYTDLMKTAANGHLDERQLSFIHNINKGSEQLEHHINQLIHISEIQAGTLNLSQVTVNLAELINEVTKKWREKLLRKNLSLTVSLPPEPLPAFVDVAHMSWALDNLLSNALNYTPRNGRVEVNLQRRGASACIDVSDNGIGIAAADQPHLFDKFFRAHNVDNYESRGVGLGLYITRSIVELHDGQVSVDSESGRGSTFSVCVPLQQEQTQEQEHSNGHA